MHTNLLLVYSAEKNNGDFDIFPPNKEYIHVSLLV